MESWGSTKVVAKLVVIDYNNDSRSIVSDPQQKFTTGNFCGFFMPFMANLKFFKGLKL